MYVSLQRVDRDYPDMDEYGTSDNIHEDLPLLE